MVTICFKGTVENRIRTCLSLNGGSIEFTRRIPFIPFIRYDIDRWLSLRSSSLDHFHPSHQVRVIFIHRALSLSTGCYLYL